MRSWRERTIAHLAPRGEEYVSHGKLVPAPQDISASPKFPGCSSAIRVKKKNADEDRERHNKRSAAASSVVAAVFLTVLKLIVGLMTGSLGILAEATHSGLDLVAAVVTLFAVRLSDRPPMSSTSTAMARSRTCRRSLKRCCC